MNTNIAVKDLKRVVAGINNGGDRGGPPASYIQTTIEIQKVASEKGADI
ncbi:hypothetical protein [Pseudoalteromonas luteoviolacea]|nr:hypothetical protein [Pseudoalteromonas luteoviolacea]